MPIALKDSLSKHSMPLSPPKKVESMAKLHDGYNREINYARFSLTEACNMSCNYCLPSGYPNWYRNRAKLTHSEVAIILKGLRRCGFEKVRFTGGEPTLHPKAINIIESAQKLGFKHIAMTTNGVLIDDVSVWRTAGLTQINISLDTIDKSKFKSITGSNYFNQVIKTINQSISVGLKTKINAVLQRSINGSPQDILDLVNWAKNKPITLRFIELMPTILNKKFAHHERVLGHEITSIISDLGYSKSTEKSLYSGPESLWTSPYQQGKIGFINPLSCNFCADCNRIRIRANGSLKLCLFGSEDHKIPLANEAEVERFFRQYILQKPERHNLENNDSGNVSTFRTIGG